MYIRDFRLKLHTKNVRNKRREKIVEKINQNIKIRLCHRIHRQLLNYVSIVPNLFNSKPCTRNKCSLLHRLPNSNEKKLEQPIEMFFKTTEN